MFDWDKIIKPALVVDAKKVINNIRTLKAKLNESIVFRPHFKTHDNIDVGKLFLNEGIKQITVSSVEMAERFIKQGFKDITIAFPINIKEIDKYREIAEKIKLNLCVSNIEGAKYLSKVDIGKCGIYIEIDTGDNRSGIIAENIREIDESLNYLSKNKKLKFNGFLTHNGSTYRQQNVTEIINSANDSNRKMISLKEKYQGLNPIISVGDTPSVNLLNGFSGIDELRPGNFVYYDLMQLVFKSCSIDDIAAKMYCPIVDINKSRNQIIIYGGAVHFSKESIIIDDKKVFGLCKRINLNNSKSINAYIISLSQEHGIIEVSDEIIESVKLGDLAEIIPVHSCLTANLMNQNTVIFNHGLG